MADAVGMHVGFVREIHEVVHHETPVAFQAVERAAFALPFDAVVPMKIRHGGGISQGGIAWPDPHEPVFFHDRIGPHAGGRIDSLLRRHVRASARGVENEAVIAANHLIADEPAHRERQEPVPAGVLERRDASVGAPEEHDVLVADAPSRERWPDFVAPGRRIPGVQRKRVAARHRASPGQTQQSRGYLRLPPAAGKRATTRSPKRRASSVRKTLPQLCEQDPKRALNPPANRPSACPRAPARAGRDRRGCRFRRRRGSPRW